MIWNLIGLILPLGVAAITVPLTIRNLGNESFGVLTILWSVIGYFSVFELGLGKALTQYLSSLKGERDFERRNIVAISGMFVSILTGCIGAGLLLMLSSFLAYDWLNLSLGLQYTTNGALIVAAFGLPLTTFSSALRGICESEGDFRITNMIRIILGVSNFVVPLFVTKIFSNSLVLISLALVVSRLVVLLINIWWVFNRYKFKLSIAAFDFEEVKVLVSFGGWLTVSNIVGPVMVSLTGFLYRKSLAHLLSHSTQYRMKLFQEY